MSLHKFFGLLFFMAFFPCTAYAYIDPGSGMLMLQGLIAAIGACIAFVKDPIGKIKALFGKFKSRK